MLEVIDSSFSYGINAVIQPGNADRIEFIIEEAFAKLSGQNRELFHDR